MIIHDIIWEKLPHLIAGLQIGFEGTPYTGLIRADLEDLTATPKEIQEEGKVKLDNNGPWVYHRFIARDNIPGLELDLAFMNGEVENSSRTPHIFSEAITLTVPAGMALVSRMPWTEVELIDEMANRYRVTLNHALYQGSRDDLLLAIIPAEFMIEGDVHPMVMAYLSENPRLHTATTEWIDGLERHKIEFDGNYDGYEKAVMSAANAVAVDFFYNDNPRDELHYLEVAYGGMSGGGSIRFDFGAEFDHMTPGQQYRFMHAWATEIYNRPQRGFLSQHGEPFDVETAPANFSFVIGPEDRMFPSQYNNPYGFSEDLNTMGSQDLQHGIRWFGPDLYLAQRFGCPIAIDRIKWGASAGRADLFDAGGAVFGDEQGSALDRGWGWNAVLQAADWHFNKTQKAYDWLVRFVDACARAQTIHGGIRSDSTSKEAVVYGRVFRAQQEGVADYTTLPIEPVTQPYQEMILAYGLHMAGQVGIELPEELLPRLFTFLGDIARPDGAFAPWYRCTIAGERRDQYQDGFYWYSAMAMAQGVVEDEQRDRWIDAATGGSSVDPYTWLINQNPSNWNNRWHLIAQVKS